MPKGYKNAIPVTDQEAAAIAAEDAQPGANAPEPAQEILAEASPAQDPIAEVSEDLSASNASEYPALQDLSGVEPLPVQADEPQASYELVSEIPPVRQPKLKYADVIAFVRSNPGQPVKVTLGAKTSANGAAQTIRRNFPDVKAEVRTDPSTGVSGLYLLGGVQAAAPAEAI